MALTTGTRVGHYELVTVIGRGGMGEVYRATDTRLNRDVALKTLPETFAADPDRVARFKREAQVLASLNHPNVASIYGIEESAVVRALVMELVEGPTLADRLAEGPMAPDEAVVVARQIVEAIEYAHEQGVIHRDLKPANIKIAPSGMVKVLDFGLAKAFAPADTMPSAAGLANSPTLSLAATQAGLILGTAAYMSPEQAKGKPADRRADIWSFGIVLFEMLSGQIVYSGETTSDTMAAVLMKEPDWAALPATTPPRLRELLRRCLVKDPRSRLQAIGEARIALDEALKAPAAPAVDSERPAGRRPSARALALSAAALLLVGLAGAYTAWRLKPEPPRDVARFQVGLPEGERFSNTGRQVLALSPDGRSLAFVAGTKLYLRPLAELEARVIPGSDDGRSKLHPVFSPDGQSIAYYSDDSIKRLAVRGGAPVTICTADAVYGLEWDEHGLIFGQRGTGIARVSDGGGTPEVVVKVEPDQLASTPQFLPGGRSLLFSLKKATESWDQGQIVVQPLDGGPRKTVYSGGSDGRYLPSGHLAYAVSGVVFVAPFDLARLEVAGPSVPAVEGVRRAGLTGNATGSAHVEFSRTGTLVYWPGPVELSDVGTDLALFDRKTNAPQPLKLPPRRYRSPRVSPDGKFVAFDSEDDREAIVWVYELAGSSAVRQLTFQGKNRAPIWSHDGLWIMFQSDRDGDLGIYRQKADGSGTAERLTKAEANAAHWPQSASSDGAHLLFSVTDAQDRSALWVMTLKDRKTEELAGVAAREATFSPDGRWIAYQRGGIFLEPFPRTGAQYRAREGGGHPFWSPANDEIFMNIGPGRSAVIAVTTTPTVKFGRPLEVERRGRSEPNPATSRRNADMHPNGQYIVGILASDTAVAEEVHRIRVVLNWFDELRQRAPGR